MDWARFEARRAEAANRGKRRGIGMAYYLEATGGGPSERAEIRFADDGFVDVFVGTQSTGQGHETAYVQLTVDRLGVPGDRVRIRQGDTDTIPSAAAPAARAACIPRARRSWPPPPPSSRRAARRHPKCWRPRRPTSRSRLGGFALSAPIGPRHPYAGGDAAGARRAGTAVTTLDAAEVAEIKSHTFPNGCHIAEVEVDPETGHVAGPPLFGHRRFRQAGQPADRARPGAGGVAQGLGQAVMERTGSTAIRPVAVRQFHGLRAAARRRSAGHRGGSIEVPCGTNPLGVKGAGEAGAVGARRR